MITTHKKFYDTEVPQKLMIIVHVQSNVKTYKIFG